MRIVFRLLGYVMLIEGALLLLPAAASWIYGEWFVLGVFLITAAVSAAIRLRPTRHQAKNKMFYMREGFAATSLSWIVISIVGAVPFVVTGCIPNPVDALFETVSGFTTTGASILPGVEDLPKGILFWRSFTHWIGGMGVLVFLLSLLPLTGGSHVNLMKQKAPVRRWIAGAQGAVYRKDPVRHLFCTHRAGAGIPDAGRHAAV